MKQIKCPACGREVKITSRELEIASAAASRGGLATIAVPHGDHVVEVTIDERGAVRSVRAVPAAEESPFSLLDLKPIPAERTPPLSRLSRRELMILVYVDGVRTAGEISRLTGIPLGEVKSTLEMLKKLGYVKDIIEVVK